MESVRQQILNDHRETITDVIDVGHTVAAAIETWPVSDPDLIRVPLETSLRQRGLLDSLLEVPATGAGALDETIQGVPVPAPPYLIVTSRGPLCRGTLSDGRRLVVEFSLFAVENRPRRYRFREPTVPDTLTVAVRDPK